MKTRIRFMPVILITILTLLILKTECKAYSSTNQVQDRINELCFWLEGTYFNVGQSDACGTKCRGHGCGNCDTANIVKTGWFKQRFSYNVKTSQFVSSGRSCVGFAWFAEWYIFRANDSDTVRRDELGSFPCNYSSISQNARLGDYIYLNGHAVVYLGCNASGIQVLDCNWSASNNCLVQKHTISYSYSNQVAISRCYSVTNGRQICAVHTGNQYGGYGSDHPHYNYYICDTCGSLFTDGTTTPQGGNCSSCHTHYYTSSVIPPTCTDWGYTIWTCSCGSTYTNNMKAPGHLWDSGRIVKEPTPAESGIRRYTCNRCGTTQDDGIPAQEDGGICGESVGWTLGTDGTLSIAAWTWHPVADIYDYEQGGPPWAAYNNFIKKVVIGDHIGRIGNFAFFGCKNIEEVVLSSEVTSIGNYAFASSSSLQYIDIPDSVQSIEDRAFNCSGLVSVTIPDSVTELGVGVFNGSTSLKSAALGNGIREIKQEAFRGCYQLETVILPNHVESIQEAFFECCSLTSVSDIPATTTFLDRNAFRDCTQLEAINISEDNPNYASMDGMVYTKDMSELINCPGGKVSVVIPEGVQKIQNAAFSNSLQWSWVSADKRYSRLESVVIPASVTEIADTSFVNNPNLRSVQFLGGRPDFLDRYGNPISSAIPFGLYFGRCNEDLTLYYYDWTDGWDSSVWSEEYKLQAMEHTEHRPVTVKGAPASWTSEGTTDSEICELCGEILIEAEVIPALREAPKEILAVGDTGYNISEVAITIDVEAVNQTNAPVSGVLMAAVYVNGQMIATSPLDTFTSLLEQNAEGKLTVALPEGRDIPLDDVVIKVFFLRGDTSQPLADQWVVEQ